MDIYKERTRLHRELAELNEALQAPAIYSSKSLLKETKAERREVLNRLRALPLAA